MALIQNGRGIVARVGEASAASGQASPSVQGNAPEPEALVSRTR
jgi:hypothetical protein